MLRTLISREKLAENIRELVMRFSRMRVKEETGVSLRTLDNYLSGDSEPKVTSALAIAKVLGTTVEYLVLREGPKSFSKEDLSNYQAQLLSDAATPPPTLEPKAKRDALDDLFKTHAVLIQMKRDEGLLRENLALRTIDSDSMSGFKKGDIVLIDTADTTLKDGNKYYFRYMNEGLIREVSLVPGKGWVLRTNNDKHDDQIVNPDDSMLTVEGRVIAASKFF